ncbi:hypothetical protein [Brevundimonas sp.]|uniref:hypothetical protein n=1 Tax=Brevundimonas sp. TaxID=1871086 RepID=UPI0025C33BD0|nr:hypothetical protein [Brevundimonas sp.]
MFTADELRDLPVVISAPRFATYLRASANDVERALELYHWNLEVSAAFIVPLQVCEVAVRNGVVEAIEAVHGPNWPWSNGFIRSLPVPRLAHHYNPQTNLRSVAALEPTTGKVVASLNFAFWEKTLTVGQDARLWIPHLHAVFPGIAAATPAPAARAGAFGALQHIRHFRNRIAHHEPIFARALADDYARIREVIGWRRPVAANWMDKVERITGLLAARP